MTKAKRQYREYMDEFFETIIKEKFVAAKLHGGPMDGYEYFTSPDQRQKTITSQSFSPTTVRGHSYVFSHVTFSNENDIPLLHYHYRGMVA